MDAVESAIGARARYHESARTLLERARASASSARVWMKSALLERDTGGGGTGGAEERLLCEAVGLYPNAPKLWLMLGQLYERTARNDRAREAYAAGLRHCPGALALWTSAATLEERTAGGGSVGFARARTLLETARQRIPASSELLLAAIRLERRAGNERVAESLLASALRECPSSGLLMAEDIDTAPRHSQKRKSMDALTRADSDPHVVLAVARLFASERKADKARKWFGRARALDPDLGDAWAASYAFEMGECGSADERAALEAACASAEPKHGERWCAIAKAPLLGTGGGGGVSRRPSPSQVMQQCAAAMRAQVALA